VTAGGQSGGHDRHGEQKGSSIENAFHLRFQR
jgi:hypothetical protein